MDTKVTEINIIPLKPKDGLVALASCVIDGKLYVGSIGLYTRLDGTGYRLTYPNKKLNDSTPESPKYLDLFHPINKETGNAILNAIVEKYERLVKEQIVGHNETLPS